jgi:hypothetical protein
LKVRIQLLLEVVSTRRRNITIRRRIDEGERRGGEGENVVKGTKLK